MFSKFSPPNRPIFQLRSCLSFHLLSPVKVDLAKWVWAAYARITPRAISLLVPPVGQSGGNKNKLNPNRGLSRNNGY